MSPFAALAPVARPANDDESQANDERTALHWAELAQILDPGAVVALAGSPSTIDGMPPDWRMALILPGVQMVATENLAGRPDPEAILLGDADVDEMTDLVRRTEPGPFLPRTHHLGRYLGIRRNGVLVAMAGERMHPPGWTEISAVCTDPAFRGQGLARRLISAVAHGIQERGETPFLHSVASNASAIGLYESLGFVVRMRPDFFIMHAPD